jgi:hypothetical protein
MMRRVALAALALALVAGVASAAPIGLGIGAYGGLSFPIVQDDVGDGSVFGVRVPIRLVPMITIEPYWLSAKMDDAEEDIGGITYTRDGFDHTGIGANAILGHIGGTGGFSFYPFVGIGSHKLTREGTPEIKETAYNIGLGFGITPTPKVSLQIRGELNMVKTGDTSRKFGNATVGLNYDLLP